MPLPTRIGRLRPPVLCLIASREAAKDGDIEKLVTDAVAGGVGMVQLREHDLPAGELLRLARRLKLIIRGKALLIINDRIDVAIAVEADGAQLPEEGLPTLTARGLLGRYAVLGRIRADPKFQNTKVVAVTANVLPQDQARARTAGFDGFIGKPLDFDHFRKHIQALLDGEQVWAPR
jgi:hypothetical protein